MPQAIHSQNAAQPKPATPSLTVVNRARPHIPPASGTPASSSETLYRADEDYKFLFKMMFRAIEFFDRCEDIETLIDAGKMFQYLVEVSEDALAEVWEVN